MAAPIKFPFYAKIALILFAIYLAADMLLITSTIVVPLLYATIIAILLNPFVNWLCKRMNRIIAIAIALLSAMIVLAGIIYFLTDQVSHLSASMPQLNKQMEKAFNSGTQWVSHTFHIAPEKIDSSINHSISKMGENAGSTMGTAVAKIGSTLALLFLLPVYTFMILYYKPLLMGFIKKLGKDIEDEKLLDILSQVKKIIQSYLVGLMIEAAIISTLNSVGLLALGIDYAIFLGILGGILNIIPYIGGIVAVALPMLMALATKSPSYALWVLVLYMVIQFVDNHYISPAIVASKVRLNALVSIIVVFLGGMLWGIPGMFLAIPLTAIIKVIFDHIDEMEPWGYLLGDTMPVLNLSRKKRKVTAR